MTIRGADIGFVLQGAVGEADHAQLVRTIAGLRERLPGCQIVLSTWPDCASYSAVGADTVIYSDDPGPLHSVRPDGKFLNNVNRQIVSTRQGLAVIDRPFAVKLRVDCSLDHLGFLQLYQSYAVELNQERIVTCAFFSVDPKMFEQVPFHISDWFQFGPVNELRAYWDCPLMTPEDAVYYGSHAYAPHSTYIDKRFFCRLPTEQHIATAFARAKGYEVPAYHNDIRPEVMADHDRFIAERLIIAGNDQIGLNFPKYDHVVDGGFQRVNCITFTDWLGLAARGGQITLTTDQTEAVARRRRRKARARGLFLAARPFWPILASSAARVTVNRVLRLLFFRR